MHNHSPTQESPHDLVRRRLEAVTGRPLRTVEFALDGPRRTIVAESELGNVRVPAAGVHVVASGIAAHVRLLADGRRQILELHLPGDLLELDTDERVAALTTTQVVDATPLIRAVSEDVGLQSPLGRAWVAARRTRRNLQRDHVVRLGRLSAYERLGHLLLEVHERLFHVGLASARSFQLPLRQDALADLLGLSVVHVSRTTQQLKREGLILSRGSHVTLPDRARLVGVTGYVSRFAVPVTSDPRAAPRGYERQATG